MALSQMVCALGERGERAAERRAILQHGFATVGIIALVDEATGYQDFRARDTLTKILERFAANEIRLWVKTYPQWGKPMELPFPDKLEVLASEVEAAR